MASGTFYLRPSSDVSLGHSLVPEGSSAAYLLINEEVADGEATYIYAAVTATSSFAMSGNLPSEAIGSVTGVRLMGVAYCEDEANPGYNIFYVSVNGTTFTTESIKSTADFSADIPDAVDVLNSYATDNNALPEIGLRIYSSAGSGGKNGAPLMQGVSQVYLAIDYEYQADIGVHVKRGGTWEVAKSALQKQGGAWVEIDGDACKAALSGASVKGGVILKNLAPSMDELTFKVNGGSTTCEMSTAHVKYGSRALCITSPAGDNEEYGVSSVSVPLVPNHFYYACVEGYQEEKLGSVDFFWPSASPSMFGGQAAGDAGTWKKFVNVTSRSSFAAGSYPFRLDFNNGGTAGKMWFDGVMLIDLTEAFGAGNEPGAAWCSANIPYFTGMLEIPVRR